MNLHNMLFSEITCQPLCRLSDREIWYDPWKRRAGIRMKSAFFMAETKIHIQEMVLKGGGSSDKVITAPVIVDERNGILPMEVEYYPGPEIDLTATVHHISALESTESIEVRLYIDLFGNGNVMLPQRNKPVTCKAQVVFG